MEEQKNSLIYKLRELLENNKYITGTYYWYIRVCPRACWFLSRKVMPDQSNELLELGRVLHELHKLKLYGENKYVLKQNTEIVIDNRFVIDIYKKDFLIELKKTSKVSQASKLQLAFYVVYLYIFKSIKLIGKVKYLEEKKVEKIDPQEWLEQVYLATCEIIDIVNMNKPPLILEDKKICKNCAYFEFCFS